MTKLHAIWALVSIGAAWGLDVHNRPAIDRARPERELADPTGKLELLHARGRLEVPLIDARVLARDLEYPFGKRIAVRELSLRSPAASDPDVELFVALDDGGLAARARDLRPALRKELPVLAQVIGGLRSRLRIDGKLHDVIEGRCVIEQALPMEEGEPIASWRIKGKLDLTLRTEGVPEPARASFKARAVW